MLLKILFRQSFLLKKLAIIFTGYSILLILKLKTMHKLRLLCVPILLVCTLSALSQTVAEEDVSTALSLKENSRMNRMLLLV